MYIKEYMANEKIELPYNNNFRIKYGIKDNNIDVTDICRNKCIHNKIPHMIPRAFNTCFAVYGVYPRSHCVGIRIPSPLDPFP